ncbi:MAG: putative metalloprotease CJM1_0395 family protein, partial [Pseudomonadota bacterium]
GEFAGEPSYSYQTGPDGRQYAVGGEVPIDVSPVPDDPEATIAKMDVVKRAALAPAEPSTADRRVAAEADAKRLAAMAELMALRSAEQSGQLVDLRL